MNFYNTKKIMSIKYTKRKLFKLFKTKKIK